MAKKVKQTSQKSIRKTLLSQIEGKLSETLKDFPKKLSEKKYKKKIHKAGKILAGSIAIKPVKVEVKEEKRSKKSVKTKLKKKADPVQKTESASGSIV
jgi:hypothetical protein